MTPSMLIPCSAVLSQHIGRIPYAVESNVAMQLDPCLVTILFPVTVAYIANKISSSLLRYFASCLSKSCSKLGQQIGGCLLTWVKPFFYPRSIAQAHPLIPARFEPCYGAA